MRLPCEFFTTAANGVTASDQRKTYKELFSVTLERKGGEWVVTKYDSMY